MKKYERIYNGNSQTIPDQAITVRDAVESSINGNSLGVHDHIREVQFDDDDAEYPDPINSLGVDLDGYQMLITDQNRKASEAKARWREKKEAEAKAKAEAEANKVSASKGNGAE